MHDVITVTLNPAIDRTAAIPGFATGTVNRATSVHDQPGGKGVNVAAALARATPPTASAQSLRRIAATGFLGEDNRTAFEAFFEHAGIDNLFLSLPGSTRIGIKIVDTDGGITTDINFPGLPPSPADLAALSDLLLKNIPAPPAPPAIANNIAVSTSSSPFYVLTGSLPPGVPASIYADWTRRLRARGARVALDTSGEALAQALSASPTFIKPNIDELSALLGHKVTSIAGVVTAARTLIERHDIMLVVVSMGADGACFVTANEALHARPPAIKVQSTVGAGDAMVAGILQAMLTHNLPAGTMDATLPPLESIARLGTAFSVSALSRPASAADFRKTIAQYCPLVTMTQA